MLQRIKACFGLSNSSLANYLGSSLAMANSIFSGRRSPNLHQWQSIIKLHQALDWNTPLDQLDTVSQLLEREQEEASPLIEAARQKLAEDLQRKRKELATLQCKRQAWLRGLYACTQLLQTDLSPVKRKWVALRQRHLLQKLKDQSLYKQWVLEAEVRGLEARMASLDAYFNQTPA